MAALNRRAIAVYLRASTSRQTLRSQEPELQTWLRPTPVALYGHLNPYGKYRFDFDEDPTEPR